MSEYNGILERYRFISIEEFLDNIEKQFTVIRTLQVIVQAAIDINAHILAKLKPGNNNTNFEAFIELGQYGVISSELARQLARSAGLRNRLVHEYEDIDPNQVFIAINFALQQYPLYVEQVDAYLISLNSEEDNDY